MTGPLATTFWPLTRFPATAESGYRPKRLGLSLEKRPAARRTDERIGLRDPLSLRETDDRLIGMKAPSRFAAALALVGSMLLGCNPASKNGDVQEIKEETRVIVRLAHPGRRPMNDDQVQKTLSGKKLVVDLTYKPAPKVLLVPKVIGGCGPVETFFADGRWRRIICAIDIVREEGRWFLQGNLVCITFDKPPVFPVQTKDASYCRALWATPHRNRVILNVPEFDDTYNAYRIAPIDGS